MNQIPIKALLIGTAMCLVISIVMPFGMLVMGTVQWSGDFISAGAILLIFIAVLLNVPLRLLKSSWALTPQDLVIVYTMILVGSAIPTVGLTAQLIPFLGEIFYFATPENDWQSLLQPYIKPWLVPQDELAVWYFFEGLPEGQSIPWGAWMVPLAAWGSFALALYLMMIAIVALIHKQWSQHERLIYPLIQLPAEMLREADDGDGSRINPFLRNPLMWFGFLVPIILLGAGSLHKYFDAVPALSLVTSIPTVPGLPDLFLAVRFIVVGLTYFLSLEISFSLWFFYLFYQVQLGIFAFLGYSISEHRLMHTEGSIATAQQAMGAMIALVLIGLWTARGSLKSAFHSAFARQAVADDEGGLLSNRTAVWLLLASSVYTVTFLNRAGLPLAVAICLIFIAFVVFFGLTRIVAEGGMGYGRAMMTPTAFTTMAFGTSLIGPQGHMVLAFSNGWAGDIKICLMAAVANGTRLAERFGVRGITLFWAMILAIVVSLVASSWLVMTIAYNFGGINLHYWFFHYMGDWSYRNAALVMATPVEDWNFLGPRGAFTVLGAAVMLGFTWLRHTFLWWPLHPIGFPIGGTYMMYFAWSSMCIGWLFKFIILRYGGTQLYSKLRPFFLGMVLGEVTHQGIWMAIDYLTGSIATVHRW
jgi:hypothetical protein